MAAEAPAFPFTTPDPAQPPAEYAKLREEEPVARVRLPSGDPAWLVTRHEDVKNVLSDRRFSREAITAPGAPNILPIARGSKSIFVMDPPEHTRLRGLISKAFSPRRVNGLRPEIQGIAGDLLEDLTRAGSPGDLIAGFAQPLPITVICTMLGVPHEDVAQFRAWTDIMLSFRPGSGDEVLQARELLSEYLRTLIEAKRREPADDLLTALTAAQEDADRLSVEELLAFGYTLLGAGYHATTAQIVHAVLILTRSPDRMRRLRDEPGLWPTAVEEFLRYSQAGGGLGALRIAVEDVRLGDVMISAGDAVLPMINSANRDTAVFAEPDGFDEARTPNPHVAFGYGIHHCLGAQLGRIELEVALSALLRHLPGLRLAVPEDELSWIVGMAFPRPVELPVAW